MYPRRMPNRIWMSLFIVGVLLSLLTGAAFLSGVGGAERADVAHNHDNLLRLHVVAHSDAPSDQEMKLRVRDALLREMATWELPGNELELERWIVQRKSVLVEVAETALLSAGYDHPVSVEVGPFAFPQKRSGNIVLPAGEYRAVKVTIGDGAGRNWWCVLFPPLCFVEKDGELVKTGVGFGSHAEAAALNMAATGSIARGPVEYRRLTAASEGSLRNLRNADEGRTAAGEGKVEWRLRLWESLSDTVYADRLKDLLYVSLEMVRQFNP